MKAGNAETIPLEEQSEVGGNSEGGLAADTSGREENFREEGELSAAFMANALGESRQLMRFGSQKGNNDLRKERFG